MLKKVPWPRIVAEGIVIIVSILLAFGIDAWWQDRQEARRLNAALTELEAGFRDNRRLVEDEVGRLEQFQAGLTLFLTIDPSDAALLEPDTLAAVLTYIHRPVVDALNSEELIAMLEDGALQDLNDPELRAAFGYWRSRWQTVISRHESIYRHQDEALRALARLPAMRLLRMGSTPDPREAFQAARADDEILALATVKLEHWSTLQFLYAGLSQGADSVLRRLDNRSGR